MPNSLYCASKLVQIVHIPSVRCPPHNPAPEHKESAPLSTRFRLLPANQAFLGRSEMTIQSFDRPQGSGRRGRVVLGLLRKGKHFRLAGIIMILC
jgi:hypothetical protein